LNEALSQIENELDDGVYRPGRWAGFLRVARRRPKAERLTLATDVTRVSDKLHRRKHALRFPFWVGLAFDTAGTAIGVALLEVGLDRRSTGLVIGSSVILTVTIQPLVKIAVGFLIGLRYSHFFFFGIEPRFKMRYGTYLNAERWGRVLLHLSGTVGSPFALWWVATRSVGVVPRASTVCEALFLLVVAIQVVTFTLGLAGMRRLGPIGLVRHTSGGGAAYELRNSPSS
jgi:hypothetical protein